MKSDQNLPTSPRAHVHFDVCLDHNTPVYTTLEQRATNCTPPWDPTKKEKLWQRQNTGTVDTRNPMEKIPPTNGSEATKPLSLSSKRTCSRQSRPRKTPVSFTWVREIVYEILPSFRGVHHTGLFTCTCYIYSHGRELTRPSSQNQTIPADLAARGYTSQLCLDFSNTALELMRTRHAEEKGIEWRWADVRALEDTVASSSVDVAFDKGTLDAMIHGSPWSPPDQVLSDTSRYMREVRDLFVSFLHSSFLSFVSPFHLSALFSSSLRAPPQFSLLICDSVAR